MRIVQTFILALLLWLAAASPALAAKIGDLVQQQSTSTGTGNFTLSAISDGTRSFNTEFGTGGTDKFYYFIQNESAVEWEIGTGHLSAASTLVRDTVITSSNANSLVNFTAGTKDVVNDLPASLQTQLETLSTDLSGKQPLDSDLTSIAALGSGADKGLYTTGVNTWAEYTLTAAGRALIDDADAAAQRTTLGLGTLATQSGTFSGTSSGTNTGDQTITLTGNVTGSGTGSFAATIGALQVTNAMLAGSIASSKLVGSDIATVGTITSGTWSGTAIGLAKGGTNADLSATGGTSQFLKQASSGAAITVVRPACADLSNAATSCSTDATNASNIGSGTLPAGRLPNPTASTLGGIESLAAVSHNWINTISTSGVPSATQPACADLSNGAASCSTDATVATNITSGTLPDAQDTNAAMFITASDLELNYGGL